MNNYLIYKITYTFHKLGFYYYSVKYYIIDNYKKKNKILSVINYPILLVESLFKMSKIFNEKNGYYEYLEIPITTKCSLKCKSCSNLIPCYSIPKDLDINILNKSIDEFLKCINNIVYIRVLGGEPFVSKNIKEVLNKLISSNKIQRIEVVTNGTIIPKDKELLDLLKNKRVCVSISKYPNINIDKLIHCLNKNTIKYKIDKITFWMDYGNVEKRNKTTKELIKQYKNCNHICKSMLNGEIHLCPRSSHGKDLGLIPVNDDEYLNIIDEKMTIEEKKKKLNILFKKKCISACDYCDFATKQSKKIPVAEQIRNNKK